jgi:uncharacterized protein YndB with AHSA1/START domain
MPVAERGSETMTRERATVERVSDTELVWRHTLRAKAPVVFDAYTKPELVKRWWAPKSRGLEMVQCEADVRVGGAYVYALARAGKIVVTFTGKYLEISRPERVVYTAAMAPSSDQSASHTAPTQSRSRSFVPDEIMATVTFKDRDGMTELVSREVYPSKKVLDEAIAAGMESGALETMDLLAELVENRTRVERKAELELVVTRIVNAPARVVFEAWTRAELFRRWWVPKSYGLILLACEMDVRVGGQYRLVFRHEDSTMEFFGTYLEVTPHSRLVWTNEEGDGGKTVTTVSFDENAGETLLVVHDLYPSKEARDSGSADAMPEAFDQLDELLAGLGSSNETK